MKNTTPNSHFLASLSLSSSQFRKSTTNQLLVNLSAALLLLVVVFAGGIARTDYQPACIAVATLLHFSLLAALMWMSAEAVNLYLAVVRVSNPRSRNFLVGSLAICWGKEETNYRILRSVENFVS